MWVKVFRNFLKKLKKDRYFYFIYNFITSDNRSGNADIGVSGNPFPSKKTVMYYISETWKEKGVKVISITFNQVYEFKSKKDYLNWLGLSSIKEYKNLNQDLDDNFSDKRIN